MVGKVIDDPWYRIILDGTALNIGGGAAQWPPATSQQPYPPGTTDQDKSNKFQSFGGVGCPDFDYQMWKDIARLGGASDVHYYTWDNGTEFRDGNGPATDFRALTNRWTNGGLFFFDTQDKLAPHDPDANGVAVNLTPEMKISANWGVKGFMYVNTVNWTSQGSPGVPIDMHFPGEPFRDANENGRYDAGEDFVNLNYVTLAAGNDPTAKPTVTRSDNPAGDLWNGDGKPLAANPVYNPRGPLIAGQTAIVSGLLYVSGDFDCQGTPTYFGSVVTKAGMNGAMGGTPDIYWDTDLKDNWPPPGWELPRVIITRWETDL
jgi:hypothetical protein